MAKIVKKGAIIFVLVLFLGFTALSAVMYLASPSQEDLQAEADCIAGGFERNSEDKVCSDSLLGEELDDTQDTNQNTQENCEADGGTRYAENEVCITE